MNSFPKEHQCRYCQIKMVDAQKLMPASTHTRWLKENPPSIIVLKCPVCGYSELDDDFSLGGFTETINTDNSKHHRFPS